VVVVDATLFVQGIVHPVDVVARVEISVLGTLMFVLKQLGEYTQAYVEMQASLMVGEVGREGYVDRVNALTHALQEK
jgi:hypothetical protein